MENFNINDGEDVEYAPDTALPKDLYEHLERRKEGRLKTIQTTENVARFFVGWSLNSTGYFIARWLLLIGGSTNLWLAAMLCFAIASTSGFAALSNGVSANYDGGVQVTGAEKLVTGATGIAMSGAVTLIACKDFLYYQDISNQAIAEIKDDIQELQSPSFWGTDWVFVPLVLVVGMITVRFFGGGNRNV